MTELNSLHTVLVSNVTRMCEIFSACDAAYLDIPLAEISYNSAVYNESYTKNLGVLLIMAHRVGLDASRSTYYKTLVFHIFTANVSGSQFCNFNLTIQYSTIMSMSNVD